MHRQLLHKNSSKKSVIELERDSIHIYYGGELRWYLYSEREREGVGCLSYICSSAAGFACHHVDSDVVRQHDSLVEKVRDSFHTDTAGGERGE